MRQSMVSLSRLPVNWMLYGKPSAEKPHGTQIAGTPARSIGMVNSALRGAAALHAWWYGPIEPTWRAWVIGHAGSPPAGPATTSTLSSKAENSAVRAARLRPAAASWSGVTRAPMARNSRR
jgi:hypothetical protein